MIKNQNYTYPNTTNLYQHNHDMVIKKISKGDTLTVTGVSRHCNAFVVGIE